VFGRLRRVLRFYERVELPDVPAQAQSLSYGGRTIVRYPPSPASAVRAGLGKAILAALLGCAPLKKTKSVQSVEVAVRREEVVAHETLRLTTLLNDTIHLRNERLVIHYDTIRQKLRIEQVRPVVVVRDSVVKQNMVMQAPAWVAEGRVEKRLSWWKRWGQGVFALMLGLSLLGFIGYLWLRALRIG
jgi:hypothetical protein